MTTLHDLTHKFIGSAMEVHRELHSGFQELIYQRALALEFESKGIGFEREFSMPIYYKNVPIGTRRVDFFIENKIILEIKAVSELNDIHLCQALNYLETYHLEIGLLINFGSMSLEFKRLHNNKQKAQV